MVITAKMVSELRERTGAGLMDCKKALTENEGDLEKAAEYLRIKGIAKADKKADRVAAEGTVAVAIAGNIGAAVEINCETDFVARNPDFSGFADAVARIAADGSIGDRDALLAADLDGKPVEEVRKEKISTIGENISVRRVQLLSAGDNGIIGAYVHGGGSIGVLVALASDRNVAGEAEVTALAKDLAMHVAASNPQVTTDAEVAASAIESERHVLTAKAIESGRPADKVAMIVEGQIRKWIKEISLVDQPFVKNPDVTVAREVERVAKAVGANLSVLGFVRFVRGEGIEKKESNLAEEVAAALR